MNAPQHRQSGLTLIELMVTVSIIAIIAAVAFPAYERQSLKAKRTDGIGLLMEIAAKQERYIVDHQEYATSLSDMGYSSGATAKGYYEVKVETSNNDQSYLLTATPQGGQADDECGALYLDNLGNRTWENSSAQKCW
jgi:type IV pilus assembly protein PilE